ncbi:MAG: hypothetical protein C4527_07385 [Candidatus Omnitrophota bacterium]|jgi:hypothetical protein|nr:MAG: hypothetical protein C4527_07385 [Candidatus Omnitrophota bacterium]
MNALARRSLLKGALLGAVSNGFQFNLQSFAQIPGERPHQDETVAVLNPRNRVPLSFIIDDSTTLVNLAHFGIPQFHETFPDRYLQPWKSLPREIPDSFVRKFGEWCHEHGVKGKYSIVPYPACTGWVDRFIPGWSKKELEDSLELVRTLMMPDWDIHPEMVSHTRVINTKTGRPYENCSEYYMENWRWTDGKSVDQLADYIAYALRILKNAGLYCEGMTTPGGFGGRVLPELAQATLQACRDVYQTEIPHYFRHLFTDDSSVAPRVEYASGLDGSDPKCVVSIIGCTGDWFGGWDGLEHGSVDKFITADLQSGRLPEVIKRGEPAILVCHWPGIYFNGLEIGFNIFKEVYRRVHEAYDNLIWMKNCEIARYWAAKELTRIEKTDNKITFRAPFATPSFTVKVKTAPNAVPKLMVNQETVPLTEVHDSLKLENGKWAHVGEELMVCFELKKGIVILEL